MHLSEKHKQKLADDIDRYQNADNLWETLREEFVLPHYEDNPYVQNQIQWFLTHQAFLQSAATRAAPYLYFILQQTRLRHLPAEVVLLPMIESAYNPFAYSSAGAAGIWQMMPNTASGLGVKRDWWYDGRRDIVASTRAALDYLSYLGSFFDGNWLLALAAYDTGEGNVLAAIKRNVRDNKNTTFWQLPLAQETRDYVPKLLALAAIISHPERYPVNLPSVANAPCLAQIDIGGQISLSRAAVLAGISLKKLKQLNSGYNRASTDPRGPFKIILPIETVEAFTTNLGGSALPADYVENTEDLEEPIIDKTPPKKDSYNITRELIEKLNIKYTMEPGDTLYLVREDDTIEKIATHFKIPVKALMAVNQLQPGDILAENTKLIIPTHKNQDVGMHKVSPGDTIYMVKKGDTIEKIANKFHTTPAAIRVSNLITENRLQTGDRIVIPSQMG